MLHVGGVQLARMDAPPTCEALAAPALLTLINAGSEEAQVSGTPVMVNPRLSMTVGVMVFVVAPDAVTAREMDCTGQVVNVSGRLLAPLALANIEVRPGMFACACTCERLVSEDVTVSTLESNACQVKGPTVDVISELWLKAVAKYWNVWPFEMQGACKLGCVATGAIWTLSMC